MMQAHGCSVIGCGDRAAAHVSLGGGMNVPVCEKHRGKLIDIHEDRKNGGKCSFCNDYEPFLIMKHPETGRLLAVCSACMMSVVTAILRPKVDIENVMGS